MTVTRRWLVLYEKNIRLGTFEKEYTLHFAMIFIEIRILSKQVGFFFPFSSIIFRCFVLSMFQNRVFALFGNHLFEKAQAPQQKDQIRYKVVQFSQDFSAFIIVAFPLTSNSNF